ncbi:hypothetical protein [Halomicrococcus sp. SG-WS-1]|uniref:hypothetical protein n=1 Tax=Halomicrococcus sp. SG-WS-1 TaxID=3439057 RepID=UPI003F7B3259
MGNGVDRRKFLGSCVSCFLGVSLGGCSQSADDKGTTVRSVRLTNFDPSTDYQASLKIASEGELVVEDTYIVPNKESGTLGSTFVDNLPEKPDEYTIEASLVDNSRVHSVHVSPSKYGSCAKFEFQIAENGRMAIFDEKCKATS